MIMTEVMTDSGIAIKAVYRAEDVGEPPPDPGQFPYTRGIYPTMYRSRFWTMRQYAGFASARESNLRYRYLLDKGQTGLSVAFDLPTQLGLDSDDPRALGEVGKVGVRQGLPSAQLGGTIQNDILKEYAARGTYIFPPRQSMRLVTDTFAYCHARIPKWNTISISGYHIREAGATAAQELAFTLADGIAYV